MEKTIPIYTENGAYLTAGVVIEASQLGEAQKQAKSAAQLGKNDHHYTCENGYTESPMKLRHLFALSLKLAIVCARLGNIASNTPNIA